MSYNLNDLNYLNERISDARNYLIGCIVGYIVILIALILNAAYKPGMSFWINLICGCFLFGVSVCFGVHVAQYRTVSAKLNRRY